MTTEQLQKGQFLDSDIKQLIISIKEIGYTIGKVQIEKENTIDSFSVGNPRNEINTRVLNAECYVGIGRYIDFLKNERDILKEELTKKETEFKEL